MYMQNNVMVLLEVKKNEDSKNLSIAKTNGGKLMLWSSEISLGDILLQSYKINETVTKCLLSGDKFMLEMHLRQPEFTYSFCGPFTKNKKKNIKI